MIPSLLNLALECLFPIIFYLRSPGNLKIIEGIVVVPHLLSNIEILKIIRI